MHNYEAPADLLKDRVILVTGAGDGIGKAAAITYARYGATVILLGRTLQKLEEVYDQIESANYPQPAIIPLNLESAVDKEYEDVSVQIESEFGRLDGLLHNAALLGPRTPIEHYDAESWNKVMKVNLTAPFLLTKAMIPLLRNSQNASIIYTSSSVGRKGRAYWGGYAISKFGVEGLMQVVADELDDSENAIRANSINPGATRTNMRAHAYPAENPNNNPAPEEIMPLYLYLMGADSVGVSGQAFDAQPK
ncbi:MAG: YciK family oxidoreductase [Hahellaceae bacterium]|jgi:NAD(P)-dependent dehydrogenase (short-subunit alcohol dehydrogenase family)|nr:YciK family oxidoreductase [Hahellaceae bacterium]MCP5212819.1 YciK family oxidoreductase [Hahellaceae bacterium]